jgi:hypothetical protein
MELSMRCSDIRDEQIFLERTFQTGETFAGMIAEYRQ